MSYKLIVVHLEESVGSDVRIELAAEIAKAEGAHLVGLATSAVRQALLNAPAALAAARPGVAPYVANARENLLSSFDRFDAISAHMQLASVERRAANNDPISDMCTSARCSDLLVAGHHSPHHATGALDDAARLLMNAGSPVLLVPSGQQRHGLPRNIMIAWDGSAGASRAVRGALPLLQRSGTVVITIVRPASEDAASPSDPSCALILAYLAHQGVAAAVNTVTTKESVGNVLLGAARSENADLMVMGCYGHSPLKETLFGGATRDVLANPALPLFLSC